MKNFVPNFFILIKEISKKINNLFFHNICNICGKPNENFICENCQKRIKKFEKYKIINSKTLEFQILNFYQTKSYDKFQPNYNSKIYFNNLFYCFEYKGLIRKLLLKYKFLGASYFCHFFANVILNNKKINEILKFYDIMIPVPMDKIKKLKRGYNQTELIANIIKKEKKITVKTDDIKKIKSTKTQSKLNFFERQENIREAFFIENKEAIKNKNVVLFDDIYTTGATVNEISKMLKQAGANKILVLVIAKD